MFYVSSGHYYTKYGFVKYFRPEFENFEKANQETDFVIRNALIKATQKTNSRCSYWCLTVRRFRLFLITAIARLQAESGKITVFAIGLDANAPDVAAARKVAAFENRAQRNLLYCPRRNRNYSRSDTANRTYDVIVRASVPMYFVAKL
jgi:asparagine synthase (glutamine-hydrolysing)